MCHWADESKQVVGLLVSSLCLLIVACKWQQLSVGTTLSALKPQHAVYLFKYHFTNNDYHVKPPFFTQFHHLSCKKTISFTLQAQVDRIGAQCQQMETDISSLMLRLSVSPKEEAARLHSERFSGLSQSCEQIVGQEEQLKKLVGMAGDSNNRRSVYMILGAPGMV